MSKLASTLHDATHLVPGVPEHQDRAEAHHGAPGHGRSLQQEPVKRHGAVRRHATRTHEHKPPRVMIGWQNRIAGLFRRIGAR